MIMESDPDIIAAAALQATVHHLMTGLEISICEKLVEHASEWGDRDWEYFDELDRPVFTTLTIQFSREIANHINKAA